MGEEASPVLDLNEFEQLVRSHAGMVRRVVYHILRDANDVEDVTQEVFIKAYQSLPNYRGGSFSAYVTRIARNHCYDQLRQTKTKKRATYLEPLTEDITASVERTPEATVLAGETATEIMLVLDELETPDRDILLMKHVYDMSYEEIAEVMGMRIGAVRTRISRARKRFMSVMQRRDGGEASFMG